MIQTQLTVSGMTCDHCVRHVTDAISKVAGVNSVSVNLADGIATIDSDLVLDLQLVKTAVVDAGYGA
jgi:copper chaperone CopZ